MKTVHTHSAPKVGTVAWDRRNHLRQLQSEMKRAPKPNIDFPDDKVPTLEEHQEAMRKEIAEVEAMGDEEFTVYYTRITGHFGAGEEDDEDEESEEEEGNSVKKPKRPQPIIKLDAAKKPEPLKTIVTADPAPTKTPFVTVDMANFENHKLLKVLPDNLSAYANNLPTDELVVDVMLIGKNFKSFKVWFHKHAELVWSLRERLPERGPNAIRIKRGDKTQVFTWSEFCLEFFGVSSEWVRKQLCAYQGMNDEPDMSLPVKKEKAPKADSADTAVVSKLSWETLEHKAAASELRYLTAMSELRSLIKVIQSTEDRAKQLQYLNDLEKRLAALDLEPPAVGSNLNLLPDELDKKAKAVGEEL